MVQQVMPQNRSRVASRRDLTCVGKLVFNVVELNQGAA